MTTAPTAIGGDGLVVFMVATASRSIRMTIVTVYAMVGSRSRDVNKTEGISRGGLFPQFCIHSPFRGLGGLLLQYHPDAVELVLQPLVYSILRYFTPLISSTSGRGGSPVRASTVVGGR